MNNSRPSHLFRHAQYDLALDYSAPVEYIALAVTKF